MSTFLFFAGAKSRGSELGFTFYFSNGHFFFLGRGGDMFVDSLGEAHFSFLLVQSSSESRRDVNTTNVQLAFL